MWPTGQPIRDEVFHSIVGGKDSHPAQKHIELRPWRPATQPTPSRAANGMIELLAICGKDVV